MLFWDITQRVLLVPYRRLWPIKRPETSVRNTLPNNPEERRSHEQYLINRHSILSMQVKCGWAFYQCKWSAAELFINASEVRLSFLSMQVKFGWAFYQCKWSAVELFINASEVRLSFFQLKKQELRFFKSLSFGSPNNKMKNWVICLKLCRL
jgi:hypothetical protein